MPYSIETKDGIVIDNIPDNVNPDSEDLKNRVKQIRESLAQVDQEAFSTEPEGLPAEVKREQAVDEMQKPAQPDPQRQAEIARLIEKEQDPLRFAAKEGAKPVSDTDMLLATAALTPTRPQQPASQPEAATFSVGETTPAPDLQSQQLQKRFEESRSVSMEPLRQKQREKAQKIAYDDLSKNDKYFNAISTYAKSRFGEDQGTIQEGETKEEFVNRFAMHMRMLDTGNFISATQEQEWLNGADAKDVVAAGKAYELFGRTGSFYESKGQSGIQPYVDFAKSVVTDPFTLASGVTAKGATFAMRTAGKKAPLFFIPIVEAGGAGSVNALEQKREIAVADQTAKQMQSLIDKIPENQRGAYQQEIDKLNNRVKEGVRGKEVALTAAIGGTLGLIEPAALVAASRRANLLQAAAGEGVDITLDSVIAARQAQKQMGVPNGRVVGVEDIDTAQQAMTNFNPPMANSRQMDMFDGERGRALLDQQGAPTEVAEMQVKNSIGKQATLVAQAVWDQMPQLSPQKTELTSEAIIRTLGQMSDKDVPLDVMESAFIKSNVDFEEFTTKLMDAGFEENILRDLGSMYGESVSDAARTLQSLSVISRLQNAASRLDPQVIKKIKAFYSPETDNAMMDSFFALKNFLVRADKNMIVAMTTNAATLVRNAFGVGLNGTYGMGSEAVESITFSIGKSLAEKASGVPVTGNIGTAARNATKDSLGLLFYINEPLLTSQVTQKALANSPALMGKLLVTAEELKRSDLYKPVQILNTPAMMLDKFVRQAVFNTSLEKQLRRQGLNLYDVIADGKTIPIEMLRKSVDDALVFTFSKHPTNPVLSAFVKTVDHLRPISSLAFPFARFMASSVEWTYTHYNPGRLATGSYEIYNGIKLAQAGKMDEALGVINKGSEKIGKATVGLATFLGAYNYRAANQDLAWNEWKSDDGTVGDLKYLFPANVPFAMADFYIKARDGRGHEFKVRELVEALIGYKSSAGTQNWMLDKATETFSNLTGDETDEVLFEKMEQLTGEVFGQFFGRAFVPLNQISDVVAAYDRDEAIPRDAYVYREGEDKDFTTAAKKQVQKLIPFWKQALPEYQPATRELAPYKDSGVLKQITGVSIAPHKNAVEKEIQKLNLSYMDVYKTTGDRTLDSQARKVMATILPFAVAPILDTEAYKGADRQAQALMLRNALGDAQRTAKKYATDVSIAEAYQKKEVPNIMKLRYNALDSRTKILVNQMFKEMTGVPLSGSEDFTRYEQALELAKAIKKNPELAQVKGFNAGGAVTRGIKSALKLGTKAVKKESFDMLQEMQDLAARNADEVVTPPPSAMSIPTQTEAAIPTKTSEVSELLPETPQVSKLPSEYMSAQEDVIAPLYKKQYIGTDADSFFSEYPADEVAKAEKQLAEMYDEPIDTLMADYPDEFANELAAQVQKNMKVKNKTYPFVEDPDFPDTSAQFLSDVGVKTSKTKAENITNPFYIDPVAKAEMKANATGKEIQGAIPTLDEKQAKNSFITAIKDFRTNVFPDIRSHQTFDGIEDIVLGKAQGEFRVKHQREFDPMNTKDVALFKAIAKKEQSSLNGLRNKHEGEPDIILYHGSMDSTKSMGLYKSGFQDPQKGKWSQVELGFAAPSFTRDINFNFNDDLFGGANPENFVSTAIPVAEYKFLKVNTPPDNIKNAGFENAVRAVTGDQNSVRPLGIARDYYKEKEDAFIEAEKLMLSRPTGEIEERLGELYAPTKFKSKTIASDLSKVGEKLKTGKPITDKEAAIAYRNIKNLLSNEIENATTGASRAGLGHQLVPSVDKALVSFDDKVLTKLASYLADNGQTDKAYNVARLARVIRDSDKGKSPTPEMLKKAQQELIDVSTKFSKGGLASRK